MRTLQRFSFLKIISSGLCGALLSQSAFGTAPESNLWSERRRALAAAPQVASLPADAAPIRAAFSADRPSFKIPKSHASDPVLAALREIAARLPADAGTLRKITFPPSGPARAVVVHIQDVHKNAEAQKNISRAVRSLINDNGANLVALEAGFGPLDVGALRALPDQPGIRAAADFLLDDRRLPGATHAAIAARTAPCAYVGIDDKSHYRANVHAYQQAATIAVTAKENLEKRRRALDARAPSRLNPALFALYKSVSAHRRGQLPLTDYARALAERQVPRGAVAALIEAQQLERSFDVATVEAERTKLLSALVPKLAACDAAALVEMTFQLKRGRLAQTDFYDALKKLCGRAGVRLASYPSMERYVHYVLVCETIDAETLFSELSRMENETLGALTQTDEERAFLIESKQADLAAKLVAFELTRDEWKDYEKKEHDLKPFESFYVEAEARDEAMAANVLKAIDDPKKQGAACSVLVTGGFHSEGIAERLSRAGVAVVSFVPKITHVDGDGSAYLSVFSQEKTPLEKLFAGDVLFLAPPIELRVDGARLRAMEILRGLFLGLIPSTDALRRDLSLSFGSNAGAVTFHGSGNREILSTDEMEIECGFEPGGGFLSERESPRTVLTNSLKEEILHAGVLLDLIPAIALHILSTMNVDPLLLLWLRPALFVASALLFGWRHDELYTWKDGELLFLRRATWKDRAGFALLGAAFRIGYLIPSFEFAAFLLAMALHADYNLLTPVTGLPLANARNGQDAPVARDADLNLRFGRAFSNFESLEFYADDQKTTPTYRAEFASSKKTLEACLLELLNGLDTPARDIQADFPRTARTLQGRGVEPTKEGILAYLAKLRSADDTPASSKENASTVQNGAAPKSSARKSDVTPLVLSRPIDTYDFPADAGALAGSNPIDLWLAAFEKIGLAGNVIIQTRGSLARDIHLGFFLPTDDITDANENALLNAFRSVAQERALPWKATRATVEGKMTHVLQLGEGAFSYVFETRFMDSDDLAMPDVLEVPLYQYYGRNKKAVQALGGLLKKNFAADDILDSAARSYERFIDEIVTPATLAAINGDIDDKILETLAILAEMRGLNDLQRDILDTTAPLNARRTDRLKALNIFTRHLVPSDSPAGKRFYTNATRAIAANAGLTANLFHLHTSTVDQRRVRDDMARHYGERIRRAGFRKRKSGEGFYAIGGVVGLLLLASFFIKFSGFALTAVIIVAAFALATGLRIAPADPDSGGSAALPPPPDPHAAQIAQLRKTRDALRLGDITRISELENALDVLLTVREPPVMNAAIEVMEAASENFLLIDPIENHFQGRHLVSMVRLLQKAETEALRRLERPVTSLLMTLINNPISPIWTKFAAEDIDAVFDFILKPTALRTTGVIVPVGETEPAELHAAANVMMAAYILIGLATTPGVPFAPRHQRILWELSSPFSLERYPKLRPNVLAQVAEARKAFENFAFSKEAFIDMTADLFKIYQDLLPLAISAQHENYLDHMREHLHVLIASFAMFPNPDGQRASADEQDAFVRAAGEMLESLKLLKNPYGQNDKFTPLAALNSAIEFINSFFVQQSLPHEIRSSEKDEELLEFRRTARSDGGPLGAVFLAGPLAFGAKSLDLSWQGQVVFIGVLILIIIISLKWKEIIKPFRQWHNEWRARQVIENYSHEANDVFDNLSVLEPWSLLEHWSAQTRMERTVFLQMILTDFIDLPAKEQWIIRLALREESRRVLWRLAFRLDVARQGHLMYPLTEGILSSKVAALGLAPRPGAQIFEVARETLFASVPFVIVFFALKGVEWTPLEHLPAFVAISIVIIAKVLVRIFHAWVFKGHFLLYLPASKQDKNILFLAFMAILSPLVLPWYRAEATWPICILASMLIPLGYNNLALYVEWPLANMTRKRPARAHGDIQKADLNSLEGPAAARRPVDLSVDGNVSSDVISLVILSSDMTKIERARAIASAEAFREDGKTGRVEIVNATGRSLAPDVRALAAGKGAEIVDDERAVQPGARNFRLDVSEVERALNLRRIALPSFRRINIIASANCQIAADGATPSWIKDAILYLISDGELAARLSGAALRSILERERAIREAA